MLKDTLPADVVLASEDLLTEVITGLLNSGLRSGKVGWGLKLTL
jgi:hypothetical protein